MHELAFGFKEHTEISKYLENAYKERKIQRETYLFLLELEISNQSYSGD